MGLSVTYPEGMDGGGPLDSSAASQALALLGHIKASLEDAPAPELCGEPGKAFQRITLTPFAIGGGVSILLTVEASNGDGGPDLLTYGTVNLDPSARMIQMQALLPDPESRTLLWERLFAAACEDGRDSLPPDLGFLPCAPAAGPMPFAFTGPGPVNGAGNAIVTSLGLSFILPPQGGQIGEGEEILTVDIPAEELIGMGADPSYWR
jgi:hypothetical protein